MLIFNNFLFSIPGELIAIIIIIASIALFIITFILNKKTKAPSGVELPEKCSGCMNTSCKDKVEEKIKEVNSNNMTPDELIEFIKCEEEKNAKK